MRGPRTVVLGRDHGVTRHLRPYDWDLCRKKTSKRKARLRRSKANHGKRPNMGRG